MRLLFVLAAAGALAACDTTVPPPADGGDGFGPASLHFFLSDSTGAHRAGGFTEYVRLSPGDSLSQGFRLIVRLGDATDAEYEGTLRAVCGADGDLTYTLVVDAEATWVLDSRCEPGTEAGTWVRLEAGEATEGGTFETAIAIP